MAHFIFTTGGVSSSLGKGIACASLAALLRARGFTVKLRKLDPYINVDPGTMSPTEHGECYILADGVETDLDFGHYERFSDVQADASDTATTGKIYQEIISKERRGDFLGKTVQVIPHITDAIKKFVLADTDDVNFVIVEVGGTVGDIEASPFLEAIRQIRNDIGAKRSVFLHLTPIIRITEGGELKTKPSQQSVKLLNSLGIFADVLLCRTPEPLSAAERRKLALFCNLPAERVVDALSVKSIYAVPQTYHAAGLDGAILDAFGITPAPKPDLTTWTAISDRLESPKHEVKIGIVAKYRGGADAYMSVVEALTHGGLEHDTKVKINWIDAEAIENEGPEGYLGSCHALLVPGGFGRRGTEGKIRAIRYAREQKLPYLGICLGLQLAVIEAARNLAGLTEANSTEFNGELDDVGRLIETPDPVIGLMTEWMKEDDVERRNSQEIHYGGTMRLGAYPARFIENSRIGKLYGASTILERHRHRYEVNLKYRDILEKTGLVFSGFSLDGLLAEAIEYPASQHPFFIGVQYHPEFTSRPFRPHPLFAGLVEAARNRSKFAP